MKRQEAFRIAIEAEIRSQNLYKALARSFRNPESAQVFNQLVQYEENHEAKMREILAEEFPGSKLHLMDNLDMEMQGVKLEDPRAVLEFAISREELAQNIYLKLAEQTPDGSTKALLKNFAEEEANHKEVLFTELERIQGLVQWYDPSELDGFMEG